MKNKRERTIVPRDNDTAGGPAAPMSERPTRAVNAGLYVCDRGYHIVDSRMCPEHKVPTRPYNE